MALNPLISNIVSQAGKFKNAGQKADFNRNKKQAFSDVLGRTDPSVIEQKQTPSRKLADLAGPPKEQPNITAMLNKPAPEVDEQISIPDFLKPTLNTALKQSFAGQQFDKEDPEQVQQLEKITSLLSATKPKERFAQIPGGPKEATLSGITPQEVQKGKERQAAIEASIGEQLKKSPFVKALTSKEDTIQFPAGIAAGGVTPQQKILEDATGQGLLAITPAGPAYQILKGIIGGVMEVSGGSVEGAFGKTPTVAPGQESTLLSGGETTLSSGPGIIDKSKKIGEDFLRGFISKVPALGGGVLSEDPLTEAALDTALFFAADPLMAVGDLAKEGVLLKIKNKNTFVDAIGVRNGLSNITSDGGQAKNATELEKLAAQQVIDDINNGVKNWKQGLRDGATVQQERNLVKWVRDMFKKKPTPTPEIKGFLAETADFTTASEEIVTTYKQRALDFAKSPFGSIAPKAGAFPTASIGEQRLPAFAKTPEGISQVPSTTTTLETPSVKDFEKFQKENPEIAFENVDDMKLIREKGVDGKVVGIQNRAGEQKMFEVTAPEDNIATKLNEVIRSQPSEVADATITPSIKNNISTSEEAAKLILNEAKVLESSPEFQAITETVSDKQVLEESKALDIDVNDLKAIASLAKENRAVLVKAKEALVGSAQTLSAKIGQYATESSGMDAAQKQALLEEIQDLHFNYKDVYLATREIIAESGRTLRSNKIVTSQFDQVFNDYDRALSPEEVIELSKELTGKNPNEVLNDSLKSDWVDKVMEMRNMGLLTSPTTHVVNFTSNITNKLLSLPDKVFAGVFNLTESTIKGKQREVFLKEVVGDIVGSIAGIPQGVIDGYSALLGRSDPSGKLKDIQFKKAIKGPVGEVVRTPGRLLQASDDIFKGIWRGSERYSQAFRQASIEGLKGKDFMRRVSELIENPTPETLKRMNQTALRGTFQEDVGEVTKKISSLRNVKSPLGRFVFKTIAPFVPTPANIFKQTFERTPLAPFMRSFTKEWKVGGARRAEAVGRMMTGTSLVGLTALAAAGGMITGAGPESKKERDLLLDTGWRPYSIKVGDTYYSYKRLEPLGTILGWTATAIEQSKSVDTKTTTEKLGLMAAAFAENATDKSFLIGSIDLAEFLSDPLKKAQSFGTRTVASFQPFSGFTRFLRNLNDEYSRMPTGVIQQLQNQLPFLSKGLPPKVDVWGDPVKRVSTVPGSASAEDAEGLSKALLDSGVYLGLPGDTNKYWKMNKETYSDFLKAVGTLKKDLIGTLLTSEEFSGLDKDAKAEAIEKMADKINSGMRKATLGSTIVKQMNLDVDPVIAQIAYTILRETNEEFDKFSQSKKEETLQTWLDENKGSLQDQLTNQSGP